LVSRGVVVNLIQAFELVEMTLQRRLQNVGPFVQARGSPIAGVASALQTGNGSNGSSQHWRTTPAKHGYCVAGERFLSVFQ
jgi:hypothetical protein